MEGCCDVAIATASASVAKAGAYLEGSESLQNLISPAPPYGNYMVGRILAFMAFIQQTRGFPCPLCWLLNSFYWGDFGFYCSTRGGCQRHKAQKSIPLDRKDITLDSVSPDKHLKTCYNMGLQFDVDI